MLRQILQKFEPATLPVEGRPFSSGTPRFSSSATQRTSSPTTAGALTPPKADAPVSNLQKKYVLRFRDGLYLHAYRDGVWACAKISAAKLFSSPPIAAAGLFGAQVITVLTDKTGNNIRRTLLPTDQPSFIFTKISGGNS